MKLLDYFYLTVLGSVALFTGLVIWLTALTYDANSFVSVARALVSLR